MLERTYNIQHATDHSLVLFSPANALEISSLFDHLIVFLCVWNHIESSVVLPSLFLVLWRDFSEALWDKSPLEADAHFIY